MSNDKKHDQKEIVNDLESSKIVMDNPRQVVDDSWAYYWNRMGIIKRTLFIATFIFLFTVVIFAVYQLFI